MLDLEGTKLQIRKGSYLV